jgi:hypothetical protein
MDPDANIAEQLRLVETINELDGAMGIENMRELETAAFRLAELVDALDGWLVGGGAKPTRWTHQKS